MRTKESGSGHHKGRELIGQPFAEALGRSYSVLCGRGTTALWLALRAIQRRDGPGEVILPDLLCVTALEGVLLAGFTPVFADVMPGRFTISPAGVARLVTPRTRAVLVAHLFGHIAEMDLIRQAAPGIPIIEDAVQGFGGSFGGKPVGSLGDLSFISFDRHKMIGGRGGLLLFDDEALVEGIEADLRTLPDEPDLRLDALEMLLPPPAAAAYAFQLRTVAPMLLRPFDPSPANLELILADWATLKARVAVRNANARWLQERLSELPLAQPDLRAGDAIWCYTMTAPSVALARRTLHRLHKAGLGGSALYDPLSWLFGQPGGAGYLTHRLVNLWPTEHTPHDELQRLVDVLFAAGGPAYSTNDLN